MRTTIDDLREKYRNDRTATMDDLEASIRRYVQSPIEEAMIWALLNLSPTGSVWYRCHEFPSRFVLGGDPDANCLSIMPEDFSNYCPAFDLQPTVHVGERTYRLDMALQVHGDRNSRVSIDIECDGHDFHEKTKEQAEADKRRDRDLQSIGWVIARFTGSEIFRDPMAAATQVHDLWWAQLNLQMDAYRRAVTRAQADAGAAEEVN